MNSELVPALLWFGSTDVRKLARQRKCCNSIGIIEWKRSLPFCELRERCEPERPKNDQNRASCWLPQRAQQGKKKGSKITPKCFQNRPRELQNHSPELPKSSRGAPQSSQGAPKSVPGTPRSPNRAPQAPKGCPRCVHRVSKGPFGRHSGTMWASNVRSWSRCGLAI